MKRKIIPKQKFRTYAEFPLISGDVRAYEIQLDLGQDVEGAEFKVVAIRADGKVIEDLGMVGNGVATYTIANSMYAVPGELTVRLQVVHNSSVLTDREVVFEVFEGTQNASQGSTVVPLNDSIILRLSSLESKVEGKVDKVSGKGLSQNDFTNEYKEKLDSLDETIGTELEKVSEDVDDLYDEVSEHKTSLTNPHKVTAEQVGTYSKRDIEDRLNAKANKSDVVNAYRFCGSVDTFDDLPLRYDLIPNGVPTFMGEPCGTYDDETHTVTFSIEDCKKFTNAEDDGIYVSRANRLIIPIVPVTVKEGNYFACHTEFHDYVGRDIFMAHTTLGSAYIDDLFDTFACYPSYPWFEPLDEGTVIDRIEIFDYYDRGYTEEIVCGNLGTLYKAASTWRYENEDYEEGLNGPPYIGYVPEGAYDNGAVYNVSDTGMNYAWNGKEYDALGGEHKDLEARTNIENLETQMGDVETALDNIIAIQNELIGGEDV